MWQIGEPDEGDVSPCRRRFGIAATEPSAFAMERRRGWAESPASPPRDHDDMWDLRRVGELKMEKTRPRFDKVTRLRVYGHFAAFRSGSPGRPKDVGYEIVENGRITPLEFAQWADWSVDGQLLVATNDGKLQIIDYSRGLVSVQAEIDLRFLTPNPSTPPDEAHRW